MYKARGWDTSYVRQFSPLCNPKPNVKHSPQMGCMIWGAININQIAGSIHIAVRTGLMDRYGNQLYDKDIIEAYTMNHRIHQF